MQMNILRRLALGCAATLALVPRIALAQAAAPGPLYVALGSSFAAGPGLPPEPGAPLRCGRSSRNYAHLLAERRGWRLADVSCSGATTQAILSPWRELPAQIDAVQADTRWVSVTIGGNDLGYIGNLMARSCRALSARGEPPRYPCPNEAVVTEADASALASSLAAIAAAVRARAPAARLIFVDYLSVLPEAGTCAAMPLDDEALAPARRVAARLQALTAEAARASGALLVSVSQRSVGHDLCSAQPWVTGDPVPGGGAPYHPNLAGMAAVAAALDEALPR